MSKKVLIIDDSATVRQQVGLALRQAGFNVVEAVDGQDGFETLEKTPDVGLVICDVNMPRLGGIGFLEKVHGGSTTKPPILMLTTEADPGLIAKAKGFGAKGWIVKPFKADLLVGAAEKLAA